METEKMALIIGINYIGTQYRLNGCINDAKNLRNYLVNNHNFTNDEIIFMTDENIPRKHNLKSSLNNIKNKPTKQNIFNAFDLIIEKQPKKLWFSYSGHGILQIDTNGDEESGQDGCLCPCDFEKTGFVLDDEILVFLKKLPKTSIVFSLIDACHSGTILDLPYTIDTNNIINSKNIEQYVDLPNIAMISGCRDNETSEDAYINRFYTGAMTWSFFEALKINSEQTNLELVNNMIEILNKRRFSQYPLLSISHVDLKNEKFGF